MLGEHSIASRDDGFLAGKTVIVKTPIGMLSELLVALVGGIRGMKERLRIGYVNRDRNAQAAALFPNRIDARIVNRH